MSDDNPIAKLGELTKPASVLIEKISDAVGGIFKPYQIVRVAKAEAEASRIQTESQIQVTDLHRRAMHRFLEEEAKKQSNIESITQNALPLLEDKSAPADVADDWITNFFDKSRIVSDKEMQGLWSRVLAGEANAPGAFAKRTVNLLADLDKEDAILFMKLCGFGWMIGNVCPLIFDVQASVYNYHGLNFNALSHLESLGLVQFNSLSGFRRLGIPKVVTVHYYGRPVTLTFPTETENDLDLGHVLLTRAGQQLAPVCAPTPVEGFFEYVKNRWMGQSLIPKPTTEQGVAADPPSADR
ncbi:MAG: DUF2806 domain-containing protein [Candidatus Brocadia sp.]|nr:DUF2806 domain-containing protein [Candidatus Brocadia sp.]